MQNPVDPSKMTRCVSLVAIGLGVLAIILLLKLVRFQSSTPPVQEIASGTPRTTSETIRAGTASEPAPAQEPVEKPSADAPKESPLRPAFSGETTELKRTIVVPTLDTHVTPGRNVIWCASFQVAWNRMRTDVVKAPILIKNAEEIARRLNEAKPSEADLDPDSFYAVAGRVGEVLPKIQREMAAKFPGVTPTSIKASPTDLVAYAFLMAGVRFELPFFQNDESFRFREAGGSEVAVTSFGLRDRDTDAFSKTREQVELLFADSVARDGSAGSFALDLCRTSAPNQLILARIAPKGTLAETLSDLDAGIANGRSDTLKEDAILLVPDILFDLQHHFGELEGKLLLNPNMQGYFIKTAWQGLQFRLDRFGASVSSEAHIVCAAKIEPKRFIFNSPFLAVMKKRGAQHPLLVMWLENSELLCKP